MRQKPLILTGLIMSATVLAEPVQISVNCNQPTVALSPHLYGLFFEDINYAADGGLYAELIQNRSFEYFSTRGNDHLGKQMHPLYAWEPVELEGAACTLKVEDNEPLNDKNTNYLKIHISKNSAGAGIRNLGFDGIAINEGDTYDFSVYVRREKWSGNGMLTVTLEREDGSVCAKTELSGIGHNWQKMEGKLTAEVTADHARLAITTKGRGDLFLDMVSLFPQDTFMGRKNGMRKDLAQALKDLNPKFLRFPGGCIAHGDGIDNVYRWKDSVGDIAERKPNWNRWGYHQTYGLGYYEYLQLCEDLGATPLPVIPVGVSCGFTPPQECVPMDELGEWIDDALDLIEFCNGPVTSKWGALRAKMGHPESFNLKFICLGNEPHDNDLFRDRFPPFVKAIRAKHPEIKIIGTSGLAPEIPIYDLMTEQKVYSSDEHYYMSPDWFLNHTDRFDTFDRSKPLIFVGEYAAHDTLRKNGFRVNTMYSALAEAAYLTGIERNGDMVDMACYAPLFGHRLHSQWSPDLIYFDNRSLVKSPNYYIQQLFACNKGDIHLPGTITEPKNKTEQPTLSGAIGVGTWKSAMEIEDVRINGKAVNISNWQANGGHFEFKNGRLAQTDEQAEAVVSVSPESYKGHTVAYTLRARKTGGSEGFLIQFGTQEGQSDYWWNIGGWGNTRHALQAGIGRNRGEVDSGTPGQIKTGKWYDIKVVMGPGNIKCYLDDKLIHDYTIQKPAIHMAASLDKAAGEIIVKLVNPREENVPATINLKGIENVAPQGTLMLVAGNRTADNTFENPEQIKTETSTIPTGSSFSYTLPPMSVQFIRVKAH